eukprot:TRINITY_DN9783_c0_g1_i1.p1 TRINITY_DN9783_c0_g1~~TRINITY_DN9783_c0_g1_i1.p1  ORF type:complete len:405 (+),score=124.83 TRINITY_DN9783_c0_g1_i1:98-1216(+)
MPAALASAASWLTEWKDVPVMVRAHKESRRREKIMGTWRAGLNVVLEGCVMHLNDQVREGRGGAARIALEEHAAVLCGYAESLFEEMENDAMSARAARKKKKERRRSRRGGSSGGSASDEERAAQQMSDPFEEGDEEGPITEQASHPYGGVYLPYGNGSLRPRSPASSSSSSSSSTPPSRSMHQHKIVWAPERLSTPPLYVRGDGFALFDAREGEVPPCPVRHTSAECFSPEEAAGVLAMLPAAQRAPARALADEFGLRDAVHTLLRCDGDAGAARVALALGACRRAEAAVREAAVDEERRAWEGFRRCRSVGFLLAPEVMHFRPVRHRRRNQVSHLPEDESDAEDSPPNADYNDPCGEGPADPFALPLPLN